MKAAIVEKEKCPSRFKLPEAQKEIKDGIKGLKPKKV